MGAFALDLAAFATKAGANAHLVVQKTALDVLSSIVQKSPVDTGRFRANWQVGLSEVGVTTDQLDPSGAETISRGEARINAIPLGRSIWISNSLPYAAVLEYGKYPNPPVAGEEKTSGGYSSQAPAGMVRITVAEFQDYVRSAVASVT